MRPRPGAPNTGSCRRPSGPGPRSPSRVRCSSPSPRSRCRLPSSSRSRRGRPGSRSAPCRHGRVARAAPGGRTRHPETARRCRRIRSPGCPCPTTTSRRFDAYQERNAVKFLHTADWHVGKVLKGRDRLDEQRAVPADIYDAAAPSARAQNLVVKTLLRLRKTGAEVIAIAGNHDHGPTFEAYRPLMGMAGITLVGEVRRPDRGGLVRFRGRSGGEGVQIALPPFLRHRHAVRAAEIVSQTPSENVRAYDEMVRQVVAALTAGFSADTVNLLMSHLTCIGGVFGGGERSAQSIFEYSVPATLFPVSAHYVALGHLHRRQSLPAHCPVHYSGSPIAVDFGEQANTSMVCLVEASPSVPARVTEVPITSGRRLGAGCGVGGWVD